MAISDLATAEDEQAVMSTCGGLSMWKFLKGIVPPLKGLNH